MAGKVIGKTLDYGYRGNVSRTPDIIIAPYMNVGESNIEFGEPVVYDATNHGVRKIKSGDTSASIIGLAVRRIGQPYADSADGYYYKQGDTVDVLLRGSMAVEVASKTGMAARGKVFVGTGSDSTTAGAIMGATATGAVEVPNTVFATGSVDGNDIAEVTILTRAM